MNMRPGASAGECPQCLDSTQTVVLWYDLQGPNHRRRKAFCHGCGHEWIEHANRRGRWGNDDK